MMRILLAMVGLLTLAVPARSQDVNHDGFESLLVPIAFSKSEVLPGAFGTQWAGELWVHNASSLNFTSLQPTGICIPSCDLNIPSGFRDRWPWVNSNQNSAMLHVPAEAVGRVFLSARLLELSRRAQPTGVEVPIIKEAEFFVNERWILGVPLHEGTRAALRVYDPYALADTAVRVDFFAGSASLPGTALASTIMRPGDDPHAGYSGTFPSQIPSVAASFDLALDFPRLAGTDIVDIRLSPLQEGRAYWAMANVTHNETQHVLLITSQP